MAFPPAQALTLPAADTRSPRDRTVPKKDPTWHTPQGGTALRRMTPASARFEQCGTRFSVRSRTCQKLVAWDSPGGTGRIGAETASRIEPFLGQPTTKLTEATGGAHACIMLETPACCHGKNRAVRIVHPCLSLLLMAGCFCLGLAAARLSRAAELAGAEALQAAIEDLQATFGGRYLGGPRYLDRLGQLQREAQEASGRQAEKLQARFDALKREAEPVEEDGKGIFMLRRKPDGSWVSTHCVWNFNTPASQ